MRNNLCRDAEQPAIHLPIANLRFRIVIRIRVPRQIRISSLCSLYAHGERGSARNVGEREAGLLLHDYELKCIPQAMSASVRCHAHIGRKWTLPIECPGDAARSGVPITAAAI